MHHPLCSNATRFFHTLQVSLVSEGVEHSVISGSVSARIVTMYRKVAMLISEPGGPEQVRRYQAAGLELEPNVRAEQTGTRTQHGGVRFMTNNCDLSVPIYHSCLFAFFRCYTSACDAALARH